MINIVGGSLTETANPALVGEEKRLDVFRVRRAVHDGDIQHVQIYVATRSACAIDSPGQRLDSFLRIPGD